MTILILVIAPCHLYDLSSPSCKHAFNELCTSVDEVQAQIIKPVTNEQVILKIGRRSTSRTKLQQSRKMGVLLIKTAKPCLDYLTHGA